MTIHKKVDGAAEESSASTFDTGSPRCFVIAEAGVNHNRDLSLARQMIDVAAESGADAVKFQSFIAEELAVPTAPKARYQVDNTGDGESQVEMLKALQLSADAHETLSEAASNLGIEFLSTPFDQKSADLLENLGVRRFKIPSGEITNHSLLQHIGGKKKPVILSTGMSYLGEIERGVRVLRDAGCPEITLLHCTSSYPAKPEECNLRAIHTLRTAFRVPVGYSDHTEGIAIACAAVALGATVIEKHFTLDRDMRGPDHRASLEPHELRALVQGIRNVEVALGDGIKEPTLGEENTRRVARRSLVAARDLTEETVLTAKDLVAKRPGTGISPSLLDQVVGRRLRSRLGVDVPLRWEHLV